jgi:hypothetical protein
MSLSRAILALVVTILCCLDQARAQDGPAQDLMGSSNRGALCKPFLNNLPARAHDLSRESLADSPDRGRSFGVPCERMPGAGSSSRSTSAAA